MYPQIDTVPCIMLQVVGGKLGLFCLSLGH